MPCVFCDLGICTNPKHGDMEASISSIDTTGCFFCERGICTIPTHGVVKLWTPPTKTLSLVTSSLNSGGSEQPVKIWDVRSSQSSLSSRSLDRDLRLTTKTVSVGPIGLFSGWPTAPVPTQAGEASVMSQALGVTIDGRRTHAIPRIIHRFWTGKGLSNDTFNMLLEQKRKPGAGGWDFVLWYSRTVEGLLDEKVIKKLDIEIRERQRALLKRSKIHVYAIEDIATPDTKNGRIIRRFAVEMATMAAKWVLEGQGWNGVKYFSDYARLAYIYVYGGHHMDVDIGLGDMLLTRQYYHNDPAGVLPLMGTLTRFDDGSKVVKCFRRTQALRERRQITVLELSEYNDCVALLAKQARDGTLMFNAMLAARPKCRTVKAALQRLINYFTDRGTLVTGMTLNAELLDNPKDLITQDRVCSYTVPPYLIRLEHVTPESGR